MTTIRQATATAMCNLLGCAGLLLEGAAEALQSAGQPLALDLLKDHQAIALADMLVSLDRMMVLLATIQVDIERREGVREDE